MAKITVEIDDEDKKFIDDKNIDFDKVISRSINISKQQQFDNNPIPNVSQEILYRIETIHKISESDEYGLYSFHEGIPRANVSISATAKENSYTISIHINRLQDIPCEKYEETLSESGEYLSKISEQINSKLTELTNKNEEFTFYLDTTKDDEFRKFAKYTVEVNI